AIGLALHADDRIELGGVEIDAGLGRGRGGRRKWSLALGQRGPDGCCQLDRIAVAADVHVERRGVRAQQMIMDSGDLGTIGNELEKGGLVVAWGPNQSATNNDPPSQIL